MMHRGYVWGCCFLCGATLANETETGNMHVRAGLALANTPVYEGADNRQWRVLPAVEVTGKSFQAGREGITFTLNEGNYWRWGMGVGFYFPRRESEDIHLKGMGDLPFVPTLTALATVGDRKLNVQFRVAHALGQVVQGNELTLSLRTGYPIADQVLLTLNVNATAYDASLAQTYFGVTAEQAARSGYAPQSMAGGVYRTGVGVGAIIRLGDGWSVAPMVSYGRLRGSVLQSPIVTNPQQLTGLLAVAKTF